MSDKTEDYEIVEGILADTDEFLDLSVGVTEWQLLDGRYIIEKDYRVAGEVWRVHKSDPDPFPSRPHAHCIQGPVRYKGCKLHLGTAELYNGRKALGRHLAAKQFEQLIALIRPKFPDIELPLPV